MQTEMVFETEEDDDDAPAAPAASAWNLMPIRPHGTCVAGVYTYLEGAAGSRELAAICQMLLESKLPVCCDIETTGLSPLESDILLVAFTYDGRRAYVFHPGLVAFAPFLDVLAQRPMINQNIKFDWEFWRVKWGVEAHIAWDTQVTHALAFGGLRAYVGGNDLKNLSKRYLGIELNKAIRMLPCAKPMRIALLSSMCRLRWRHGGLRR